MRRLVHGLLDRPSRSVGHVSRKEPTKFGQRLFVFCIPTHQYSLRLEGLTFPSKMSNALTSMMVSPETNVPLVVFSSSFNLSVSHDHKETY